jgi:hypothetical protein
MKTFLTGRLKALRSRDESGAVLVLALIFMVVTALLITGLTAWVGNDINNVGTLESGRSALYSSDSAIQVAVANTRYAYPSSTAPRFCPNSPSQPTTNPFTIPINPFTHRQPIAVSVWCVESTNCPISACTRIETLSAYPQSQCTATSCAGNPYVQSEVVFDDYTVQNYNDCSPSGAQTTCGSTMTLYSNVVYPSSA